MNQNYKDIRTIAHVRLRGKLSDELASLTSQQIRQEVLAAAEFYQARDVDIDAVVADLEASFQTVIGRERLLAGDRDGYDPWLGNRTGSIPWRFWERYEQFLDHEKRWPLETLRRLDESTNGALGLLTDPARPGAWDRRGLVMGHVQSGKTSHYVGLICKAADAGYKLIIVLAGFHKSLRSQTQIRLEEGFLGYDRGATQTSSPDAPIKPIGAGLFDIVPKADSITTRADDGDFKRQVANNFAINPGGHPLLFVIKKNNSVLENLLNWVKWAANKRDEHGNQYVTDVPLLVVDDEADQGSIDTQRQEYDETGHPDPDHDPTAINKSIRRLLHLFDQSAYVGYTATPFANIFIHEKNRTPSEGADLFPGSFILSLPSPSNYVGPERVFGSQRNEDNSPGLPIIRTVTDHADTLGLGERSGWMPPKHDKLHVPRHEGRDSVPPSLREAVFAFLLSIAARAARAQGTEHNSMLVHVTRFTLVQRQVAEQIRALLAETKRRLRLGDGDSPNQLRQELRELWEADFVPTTKQVDRAVPEQRLFALEWSDVQPHVAAAVQSIGVREINGMAGEVLDYIEHSSTGLNVIAVGGDKLSRGLTLEGLSVSYFLRASRMYDTLMQMGRWFGYRPGYLDLCRLYTTPDMKEWFSHISQASEELREDFNRMAASRQTPRDFGHRVRSHPMMMVTSQVKMRSGKKIDVTFAGDMCETINFWRDRAHLEANWHAGQHLIQEIERGGILPRQLLGSANSWSWQHVASSEIIEFLAAYHEHEASRKVKTTLLADYIEAENKRGFQCDWTVLLASGSLAKSCRLGSAEVKLAERAWHLASPKELDRERNRELKSYQDDNHYRIRRLVSPTDEVADLTSGQLRRALQHTHKAWEDDGKGRDKPKRPSGPAIRAERPATKGLLLLYALDGGGDPEKVESDAKNIPVLGFGLSFPRGNVATASKVQYVVNNVYQQQELFGPNVYG
ncbi:MAG: Z1 domain-containing protein [Gemmatimonadetes bacterium]|nr:Z1 domain-containing protein [Gemmatimonadota bacterium]